MLRGTFSFLAFGRTIDVGIATTIIQGAYNGTYDAFALANGDADPMTRSSVLER
jgi:hypothetical protein